MAAFPNTFFTDSVGASRPASRAPGSRTRRTSRARAPRVALGAGSVVLDEENKMLDLRQRRRDRSAGARSATCPSATTRTPRSRPATFFEIDGVRYSVPGDFARIEESSKVTLLGRGSNCINTGGEKVYPEEVEMALKAHPDVYDVLVVGVPDERYGQSVAAVVQPRDGAEPTLEDLRTFLRVAAVGLQAAARGDAGRRDPAQRDRQGAIPPGQGAGDLGSPARGTG